MTDTATYTPTDYTEAVENGVSYLDRHFGPSWVWTVDRRRIDMCRIDADVHGQVFLAAHPDAWLDRLERVNDALGESDCIRLGFTVTAQFPDDPQRTGAEWDALHDAWQAAIGRLRLERTMPEAHLAEIGNRVPLNYDGPWRMQPGKQLLDDGEGGSFQTDCYLVGSGDVLVATVPDYGWYLAEFIEQAREDVPELLAEVKRLRAQVRELGVVVPGEERGDA